MAKVKCAICGKELTDEEIINQRITLYKFEKGVHYWVHLKCKDKYKNERFTQPRNNFFS